MCPKRSPQWLKEHFTDVYVKKAHQSGYRSRAIFKLKELDERFQLFKPGMKVVDLGAAPGSWSQHVIEKVGKKGRVIALDILPMPPIPDVAFIEGDFNKEKVQQALFTLLNNQTVDWVISDMLPNLSGVDSVDIPKAMQLSEAALDFAVQVLPEKGSFLIKVFQGEGFEDLLKLIRMHFTKVTIRKPKASRDRSREVYIVALEKK